MKRKITVLTLCAMLFAVSFSAQAQKPAKIHRIGYLAARSNPEPRDEGFRQGLRDLGYIEGKNILPLRIAMPVERSRSLPALSRR